LEPKKASELDLIFAGVCPVNDQHAASAPIANHHIEESTISHCAGAYRIQGRCAATEAFDYRRPQTRGEMASDVDFSDLQSTRFVVSV
jgi:hypothetical protein